MTLCKECNKGLDKGSKNGICVTCNFWLDILPIKDKLYIVRVEGVHYTMGSENKTVSIRGFGGRKWVIKFNDGREVISTNLWDQGRIPEHFRERLPDNAVFIPQPVSSSVLAKDMLVDE